MNKNIKMCTNLFLWSICLFLIVFLYYCPGQTIGQDNHGLESGKGSVGGPHAGGMDDHFMATEERCPCISRSQCPRVYGERATDVKELGFLKPCREFGTVRCCGVTVSIRIEHDKDDRHDVFDKLKQSHTKTVDGIDGGLLEKNATSFSNVETGTKIDGVIDEGGIHSNFLWDRDDDLEVAESNQSNIESGDSNATDDQKSATVTTLPGRPALRMRPRKKLLQRAGPGARATSLKDKILDINIKAAAANEDENKQRSNKELNLASANSETQPGSNVNDPMPESGVPDADTQEMSKISKLRIVRPGGSKMRRLSQQTQAEVNNADGKLAETKSPSASAAQTPSLVPRTKKRILRRKKLNTFAPSSSESEPLPAPAKELRETEAEEKDTEGPVPSYLPPPPHTNVEALANPDPVENLDDHELPPSPAYESSTTANKILNRPGPHMVFKKRRPLTSRPAPQVDEVKEVTENLKNSFNTDSGEADTTTTHNNFRAPTPFKFPKYHGNASGSKEDLKSEPVESTVDHGEEKPDHHESETKESVPSSRPSPLAAMKPLRRRLRPIRPAVEPTPGQASASDSLSKVSILTPADSKPKTESTQTSTSYTSSSSSYPNPIRKLQKLRKRVRPALAATSKPARVTTELPASGYSDTETNLGSSSLTGSENDYSKDPIKIEAPTTPTYKVSSRVSYTESRRKTGTPMTAKVLYGSSGKGQNSDSQQTSDDVRPGGYDAELEGERAHVSTSSISTESNGAEGSDMTLTSTGAEKIENEFASSSTSSTLLSPAVPSSQYSSNSETGSRPATQISHHHNRQSVKLQTHSKNDDERDEEHRYDGAGVEKVNRREKVRVSGTHKQDYDYSPRPAEETTTPIQVTSTYSKIRHGSVRHRTRPTTPEADDDGDDDDEQQQVDQVHFRNNNLKTAAPHKPEKISNGPRKGSSGRFSVPSAFNLLGGENEYQQTTQKSNHHREEEGEESYDVILDKDIRHNLKHTSHSRVKAPTYSPTESYKLGSGDASYEETRTHELINHHSAPATLPPITEPKRMRIRRPTTAPATKVNTIHSPTDQNSQSKRLHTKIEYDHTADKVETHADLVSVEKQQVYGNYESIKSTTPFPPYKARTTTTTSAPITVTYSGQSSYTNSNSKRRRVEKPTLLLESERKNPEESVHSQNTNTPAQYNQQYSSSYDQQPQTSTTTAAPYVYHRQGTKTVDQQQGSYYFNEVSTTPSYYIHTSPLPSTKSKNEKAEGQESGPKFVFPPYRFEITGNSGSEADKEEQQHKPRGQKHMAPEIVYSATVPPPPAISTEVNYYHQITPTEGNYGSAQYMPSTTPMPPFVYYTSTGSPIKEDDGKFHRHHHLHYFSNGDNTVQSTPKPAQSSMSFSGGFTPIRSGNASSTRFHAPEIFDLPGHTHESTSPAPVTQFPSSAFNYQAPHVYNNNEPKPPAPYENVMRFPGHVEIGGTKRPVSVHVKVAGLNGQQQQQHMPMAGASQNPQLQTVIDIQNTREHSVSDYVKYQPQAHHEAAQGPHSIRGESVNNFVTGSNPDGLPTLSSPPAQHSQYQYFGQEKENAGGLGKFAGAQQHQHQKLNFGTEESSLFRNHAPNVTPVQHHFKAVNTYEPTAHRFNQISDQSNSLRSPMQTTINVTTNPFANTQQQQQHLGLVPTTQSPLFSSQFENALKLNNFQHQQSPHAEPNLKEQLQAQLNAFTTSHQSSAPSFSSAANLHSLNSNTDGGPQPQMFRHNANGMFPAAGPHQQQQNQPLIQFIHHPLPAFTDATTPSSIWKFPTSEPQQPQIVHQSPVSQLRNPEESGQYDHQKHTLQYQTQDYAGTGAGNNGLRGNPSPMTHNQQLPMPPQSPQQQQQAMKDNMMMNRPGSNLNSVVQFGTAVGSGNDGKMKGPNPVNRPFNQGLPMQQQNRPPHNNLPAGPIRIQHQQPQLQQQPQKNMPHYIKEYHQHHSISQEILSQLKNANNRFNPFTGNARTSRATNLDDIEIIKAESQEAGVETTAAENNEKSEVQDSALDSTPALTSEEKKEILNNIDFVVVGKQQEDVEKDKNENQNEKEAAFTQPEVISYFSLPETETGRSLDIELTGDESEPENNKLPNDKSDADGEEEDIGADGTFREPKTIQRGFLPILPYSETDPGPLLVNVKDFNGAAAGNSASVSRTSKALEDVPPRVVVTLTDDAGTPRAKPQMKSREDFDEAK